MKLTLLTPTVAIKHPVPDWVKPSFCNFWHPGTLTLSHLSVIVPGCQKWQHNLVWYRILYNCTHVATVGVKGLSYLQWVGCCNGSLQSAIWTEYCCGVLEGSWWIGSSAEIPSTGLWHKDCCRREYKHQHVFCLFALLALSAGGNSVFVCLYMVKDLNEVLLVHISNKPIYFEHLWPMEQPMGVKICALPLPTSWTRHTWLGASKHGMVVHLGKGKI